ncbi:hypothetical protein MKW94_006176 [Papaver nudicaule]|uniref:Pistil-specific extensin-like protein n=1 Tax=Papaver nudicaule TaxID=74823 RepID=A0AA41VGY2_PAPNU|nr:hypothetical protein [Papaver nudicaule]
MGFISHKLPFNMICVVSLLLIMSLTLNIVSSNEVVYEDHPGEFDNDVDLDEITTVGSSPSPGSGPAPAPAPGPSSHLPPRNLVAVQGVVYCKPCKYHGVPTLLGATPLSGAVVRLACNNTKYTIREETKTDKNGYFFLQASKRITNYGVHKCKMFLVSSPLNTCNVPTDLHFGLTGSNLIMERKQPPSLATSPVPYTLYSTRGPFAFDPTTCPHA